MLTLSKGHDSTPRIPGPYELLESAARTADNDISIYIGHGVKQFYIEMVCTVDPAAAIVTPELLVVLPSGTELSLGVGDPIAAVSSVTSGWGLTADGSLDLKVQRIMLEGMDHILRMNHTDADSITYSVNGWVF